MQMAKNFHIGTKEYKIGICNNCNNAEIKTIPAGNYVIMFCDKCQNIEAIKADDFNKMIE